MHIEHLRFFHAVAESGSFTRAAEELLLTQPAVSSQIIKLEHEIGQKLFERQGKRVQLTRAGEILHSQSRKIFIQLREAETVLNDLKSLESGRLTLGTVDVISLYVLPKIFREFTQRYPRIEISIEMDNSANISEGVLEGELDLGFVTLPVVQKNLVSFPIYTDLLRVIASPSHPLARRRKVSLEDLTRTKLIIYKRGSVTRNLIEQVFARQGLELNPNMEIDRPEVMKKLVEVGLGVSIIPAMSIRHELEEGSLVTLDTGEISFQRELGLICRKGQFFSPSSAVFLEIIRDMLKPRAWFDREPATGFKD